MIKICSSLFFTGIMLGIGPCLATCGPVLVSYIAATKNSPLGGLRSWFIFSASRVAVYVVIGTLAGIAGSMLFKIFYWEPLGYIVWLASGMFIILLAALAFMGPHSGLKVCDMLSKIFVKNDSKSLILLGVLAGLFPCMPLLGIITYITMISTRTIHGTIMAFSFGLGTFISPLVLLSLAAAIAPKLKMFQDRSRALIFHRTSAAILAILGAHIIIKTVIEYIKLR